MTAISSAQDKVNATIENGSVLIADGNVNYVVKENGLEVL